MGGRRGWCTGSIVSSSVGGCAAATYLEKGVKSRNHRASGLDTHRQCRVVFSTQMR